MLITHELVENMIELVRVSDRMMKVKIVFGKLVFQILPVNALQVQRPEEEKREIWERLEAKLLGFQSQRESLL